MAGFTTIMSPLQRLSDKTRFTCTKEHQDAFLEMKQWLMSSPFLAYPNSQLPFLLDTDTNDVGIGAVLSQVVGGQEKPKPKQS